MFKTSKSFNKIFKLVKTNRPFNNISQCKKNNAKNLYFKKHIHDKFYIISSALIVVSLSAFLLSK